MTSEKWIKILTFGILCFRSVFGTTDPGDYAILDNFRKGLSNAELLKWPTDNQDPCGPPLWPHIFCSGTRVAQIQVQNLGLNGPLPEDFNKLTMLSNIGLQRNNFSGKLPSFNGLSNLQYAYLGYNQFDTIPSDFFVGLDSLQVLSLDHNPLNSSGWMLPPDLANSAQLTNLTLMDCHLAGPLPDFLGKMSSLTVLKLSYNNLTGELPASYSSLPLQILWLNNQNGPQLSGSLDVIASLTTLSNVWLHGNQFSGRIPSSIGALVSLERMWLNNNQLVGLVPENLTNLPALQELKLDNNMFVGPIPKVSFSNFTYASNSFCQSTPGVPCSPEVTALLDFLGDVEYNLQLSGTWKGNDPCNWISISCSSDKKVTIINLPNHHLSGTISPSLAKLDSLTNVVLRNNSINGTIPINMTMMKSLKTLDVSYNNISPPIPSFAKSVNLILDGNSLLSDPKPPGSSPTGSPPSEGSGSPSGDSSTLPATGNDSKSSNNKKILIGVVTCALGVLLVILAVLFFYCRRKEKKKASAASRSIVVHPRDSSDPDNLVKIVVANTVNNSLTASEYSLHSGGTNDTHMVEAGNLLISVQVLRNATHTFALENVLGQGGFGVVYKGELDDGTTIAVKRMESAVLSNKALDEFQAEINILSKVRHRNLVSILGYSVEDNEKLLVYEYMPRGALSKHLFQWRQLDLEPLSWRQRLNIALDVARGMEYLHNLAHQCFIHRDLKSSNILLGNDYRAKISDFGLAKLAPDGKDSVATRLAGTFGYLAPEYAVTGKVTTKIDVFSFGVVLMELLTGLMALDENRSEESRYLVSWFCHMRTNNDKLRSIIDPSLDVTDDTFQSISIFAELAGHCAAREPHQRPGMGHAVNVLTPLVDKWKPACDDQEEYSGIDFGQPLLQMVKGWKEADRTTSISSQSLDDSKGSIPGRPAGFPESFTSADGR